MVGATVAVAVTIRSDEIKRQNMAQKNTEFNERPYPDHGETAMQRKAMCRIFHLPEDITKKGALLWQPSKFPELI